LSKNAGPLLKYAERIFSRPVYIEELATTEKQLEKAREQIRDRLTQLAPIFLKNKYMLGDDFSMLDVAIAPLLWRLDYYGIDLSKNAVPLLKYAERIFSRPAYIEALTPSEKVMRK
ncbi:MAG: glutathione binding-like protein, partial [Burkholderiaceae bacterium]|nr:glutathione binding-like protein [Burkholderiaceae bacterium]